MIVSELIRQLQACDPNAIVVLAKDGDGNGFSPCNELQVGAYSAETEWGGWFTQTEKPSAVCLWPVL